MEPHGFLSGKCKHGRSNFCTLCDIEGHPERYTEKLLLQVVQEIIEATRVPLSFELGTKLMVWHTAQQSIHVAPCGHTEDQMELMLEDGKFYCKVCGTQRR